MSTRISAGQFAATGDKNANLLTVVDLIGQAASQGAQLMVLPENAMFTHPDPTADLRPHAETLDGAFVQTLGRQARAHRMWVISGMSEIAEGSARVRNTVVVMDPEGALAAFYRKVHLFDAFGHRESDFVAPGNIVEPAIFGVGDLAIGVMTCYDLRFPESARRLADAGADVILVPAAWVAGPLKEDHWATLLRARAIENTCYVISAGQTGPVCVGNSMVIDPAGVVVVNAGTSAGVVVADISAARLADIRAAVPVLRHRRFTVAERDST